MNDSADYRNRLTRASEALGEADFLVIGGGAGLSDAAGLSYAGPRFTENFAPFIARYGLRDMYRAGFHPFPSPEDRIFTVQGDYGLCQCARACHRRLYDNNPEGVRENAERTLAFREDMEGVLLALKGDVA
ncbi:hypothetical protein [Holophaga foetida]|uniref:hypothetical protein n=1 Tax=Holophaga foetida TaxID=35839 RepID=UPI00024725EF|nr:hypothetical protein [Holophaga foetida]